MAVLNWDKVGERFYETGVDHGVFYPTAGTPTVWNGLVSITEDSEGGESSPIHVDGRKVYDLMGNEDFKADIEAYSAPNGFKACDGTLAIAPGLFATQQPRVRFGFSYRTKVSSDSNEDVGYKIHLIYNASVLPSLVTHNTTGASSDIPVRKWTINAVPPFSRTYKPSAHLIIETAAIIPARLTALQNLLYGTATTNASLPTQATVVSILLGV